MTEAGRPTSRWPSAGARAGARWRSWRKKGQPVSPVVIEGRAIATTFWGKAWCDNLESYSDFANRLPRGRTYVRNGSVVDLQIAPGEMTALVSGSALYQVTVSIDAGAEGAVAGDLQGLRGRDRFAGRAAAGPAVEGRDGAHLPAGTGLFPAPQEIRFECSCPD